MITYMKSKEYVDFEEATALNESNYCLDLPRGKSSMGSTDA